MFTVAIVGGGPAGCWAAIQLASAGIEVQVIAGSPTSKAYCETLSSRSAILAPNSAKLSSHKSAWGGPEIYETAAIVSPWGGDRLASRPELDLALQDRASDSGANLIHGEVVGVDGVAGRWRLHLRSGREIGATLVVDATGRARRIARQLGATRASRFDRLIAYPAKLLCAGDAETEVSTHVLADREGWWFVGPRNGDATYALFFTDSDLIGRTGLGKIAASWARVRDSLIQPAYLAEIMVPHLAHSEALEQPWGVGWLAIGDAAAAFDPLSSSGLYFSQASAEWASQAVLSGDFKAYGEAVSGYVDGFLASRRRVYIGEHRFADHAFWQRRQRGKHTPTADLLERERMQ